MRSGPDIPSNTVKRTVERMMTATLPFEPLIDPPFPRDCARRIKPGGNGRESSWSGRSHVSWRKTMSFDLMSVIVDFSRILTGRPPPMFHDIILSSEYLTEWLCMIIRMERMRGTYSSIYLWTVGLEIPPKRSESTG
jgi:hypothetical protein